MIFGWFATRKEKGKKKDKIHAVIGQKSGQSSKFDVMQDQAGIDHRYSHGNYEYGRRLPMLTALPARTHFVKWRVVKSRL